MILTLTDTFFEYFDEKHDMAELVVVLKLDEYCVGQRTGENDCTLVSGRTRKMTSANLG